MKTHLYNNSTYACNISPVGLKVQPGEDTLEKVVCETKVNIKNEDGLHMRPAMQFVDVANRFECDITVSNNENSVDGKSIMQMSMLAATYGTKSKIVDAGAGAQREVDAWRELVEEGLYEAPPPNVQKKCLSLVELNDANNKRHCCLNSHSHCQIAGH